MNKKAKKTPKKPHTLQFFAAKTTKKILQMFYDMQKTPNFDRSLFLAAHFNADKAAMWLIQKY